MNTGRGINELISSDGEAEVIERFIKKGAVVFDVGANIGDWSSHLLKTVPGLTIHAFEPVPDTHAILRGELANFTSSGEIISNCCGVGRTDGFRSFTFYKDASSWSTFYRRTKIEKECGLEDSLEMTIPVVTLDSYCENNGIERIDFLKIDTEGGELDVLLGAQKMFKWGRIDHIQFEYGGTYPDAGITLREVFDLMDSYRYGIFKILPGGVEYCPTFHQAFEDFEYANYLAINERLLPSCLGLAPRMLNLRTLFLKHRIRPRGIIHIGAHEGSELQQYIEMGVERVLFVEANPEIYQKLLQTIGDRGGVIAAQCAISDHNGAITLHVTSMDQSSSILPLKRHQEIYPGIVEEKAVKVPCRTLDTLMTELKLNPSDFNVINIDIQGAELLALMGAEETLPHIEAINSEVNYEELYEGCARIWELDAFLDKRGFDRVATVTPYHPSWGDGFYLKRPLVTMSTLGSNGRFANQIFQYAFLRIYAMEHMFHYETSPWIGQQLFGHQDPQMSCQLPLLKETSNLLPEAIIPNSREVFRSVDFWGYFQYHTSYYAPYKEIFRSLFQPVKAVRDAMEAGFAKLSAMGKTIVALHLRRGDYGYDYFYVAPSAWYLDWLHELWPRLDDPVLFIASDEPEKVLADFADYRPVTSQSLGMALHGADYYPDFYILSRCDIAAISNSSFSFAACMLNPHGKAFFRPSLSLKRLLPFDPWDSEVILRDDVVPSEDGKVGAIASCGADGYKAVFLTLYYPAFIKEHYRKHPMLAIEQYEQQRKSLLDAAFGDSNFYSEGFRCAGWQAEDIIPNAEFLQQAWAREHNCSGSGLAVAVEQIRRAAPDVVYIQEMNAISRDILDAIRPHVKLIVGQIACQITSDIPLDRYDVVFSSFPHYVDQFRKLGVKAYYQPLAFEPNVLTMIRTFDYKNRPVPCSFVGGISNIHMKGTQLLEMLAETTPIHIWGYGAESLQAGSAIHTRHHGEAWGLDMFSILAASKMTVNRHAETSGSFANNVRLFEATGCGALLITDYKDNLSTFFDMDKEIVVYRSYEECREKIAYYLNNPLEAETIARAGQKRTLQEHTFKSRMKSISELLTEHLHIKANSHKRHDF